MNDRDLQQLFARVCRDSGWELDYVRAAILVAKIAGRTPLEVWLALGSDDLMKRLASGEL